MEIVLNEESCQYEIGQKVSGTVITDEDLEPTDIKIELIGTEEVSWIPHLYGRDPNVIRVPPPLHHKMQTCLQLVYQFTEQGICRLGLNSFFTEYSLEELENFKSDHLKEIPFTFNLPDG